MTQLLPNGKQQFIDINGKPLVGGQVFHYEVGTLTPKNTYQDIGETIPNTNPVILDARGQGAIYGTGNYRQILKDATGVTIWDAVIPDLSVAVLAALNAFIANLANNTDNTKGSALVGYYNGRNVFVRLQDQISIKDDGAVGDGVTNDLVGVNSIFARARGQVIGAPGTFLVSAKYTNIYGVELDGPSAIVTPITGGNQQLNTYADKCKYAMGKEYLNRCYQYLALGQSGGSGTMNVVLFGDSTIAGGNGESAAYQVANVIQRTALQKGIGNMTVTNLGVGGTQIGDLNALPYVGAGTNALFVIKYGINDGTNPEATRLNTFATTLRSKLAAIRAAVNGDIGHLAILLVGPNATSDTPNGRDERWYEQLRGIYEQACRDYQCAYFDTYAWLKDARGAAGLWMDNPYGDGRAIHPLNAMNAWIWGNIWDWAFSFGDLTGYRSNPFTNVGAVNGVASPATLPSQYSPGVAIQRATAAAGWPEDGIVITTMGVDGTVSMQQLVPFALGRTRCIVRTANTAGNSWNNFTGSVYTFPLFNGWVDFGQPGYVILGCTITADGLVKVQGAIKNGTVTTGTSLGQLPVGYRPAGVEYFPVCKSAGAVGQIAIDSNGIITTVGAADATFMTLSSILFRAS